jgi:hypothetical protein
MIAPWLLSAAILGGTSDAGAPALAVASVAFVYAAGVASLTMAATPLIGASAAGTLGLLAAWFGGLRPSVMVDLLGGWPYLMRPVVTMWNVLPLEWRAMRWTATAGHASVGDAALLVVWVPAGIALAAWATQRPA